MVDFGKEGADFFARAAFESALREFLAVRVGEAAHLGFDGRESRAGSR